MINNLLCQNYQTVHSDRIVFFEGNAYNNSVRCIRVDSTKKVDGDSVFYPNPSILELNYWCLSPTVASWIGKKIIVNSDFNIFFNLNGDSIKIKNNAKLNESWIAYKLIDSMFIVAKIKSIDTLTFSGLLDSVKTIIFQAYSKDSIVIKHVINSKTISISKNYGFIKTLSFFMFPTFITSYYNQYDTVYNLIGFTNPRTGITNLTKKEVYNFDVGDEIHEVYQITCALRQDCKNTTTKTIRRYLKKETKGDSIIYKVEIKQNKFIESPDENSTSYLIDTINFVVKSDSIFDKLPGEPIYEYPMAYLYNMYVSENGIRTKVKQSEVDWIVYQDDNCWQSYIVDGCFPAYEYIEGIGGPYYWCEGWFFEEEKNEVVYYKKGETVWGTPLVITDIIDTEIKNSVTIYPNPCDHILNIKVSTENLPCHFTLFDNSGKLLEEFSLHDEYITINVEKYSNGFYFYRIINKKNSVINGKLLKM